ncbi:MULTISPECIES: hypothetical protein [unclassified Mesorhizobium]|uniref:hypothetical protein n=1 Tax=unclassified Mesorhizobium TaxID=325217 RepID=UPI000FCC76B2|nr:MULTISPECIES: hypothetical protein [unclassified Mesorhizobium]RUZ59209.1 hypothetical protein EN947_35870 [Mesorhizobium sp. M7A.F.Ca.US.003.02.2.1]RUY98365.1 hypothetical protein EN974_15450 [Mesorhizobium sp. M7A.F.Ca.CA.001.12.2.1]RUZ19408.1 hypothetical protein EN949_25470 [Mesorhizobium sp. M7A.F.Ca.US.007.01.2.1]RUZ48906.1 hypothetical protein EN948_06665 [Mesorhizobium sp. M7A.F.Ca.US.003.02.1.1]RUZ67855.1 hypothetical protein EN950_09655 [Mesorhizobium sp. M7A.F.Ca.US.007.01.1.1]
MVDNLRRDDAEAIVQLILDVSKSLNEFLLDRRESRSKEEFDVLKKIIGRLMGFQYFEVVEVVGNKYKDIVENLHGSAPSLNFDFPEISKS